MRLLALTLLLIFVSFELVHGKKFEQCEFALELFEKHEVPHSEIYKHLCIVGALHTSRKNFDHLGIYAIGSRWWCGQDGPGGSCNVTCANLLDDDIADDVACASLILSQQGVEGFGKVLENCKESYQVKTEECIGELELLESLQNASMMISSTTQALETTTHESTTPPSTTTIPLTTTKQRTTTRWTTTTERTTRKPFVPLVTTTEKIQSENDEESDTIVWVIAVILIAVLITLLVVKIKPMMTNRVSYERSREFENAMSNL